MPKTDTAAPSLAMDRKDKAAAKCEKSSTEIEAPHRTNPKIDIVEPMRATDLSDKEEPRWRKSNTDNEEP
jgi:hypothetical protein